MSVKAVYYAHEGCASVQEMQIVDGDGQPVPLNVIQSMTLTLWDAEVDEAAENVIVNGRDVLGVNGGQMHATSGVFLWAATAADNVVRNAAKIPGDTELHHFKLVVVHSQLGSPFVGLYGLRVEVLQKKVV